MPTDKRIVIEVSEEELARFVAHGKNPPPFNDKLVELKRREPPWLTDEEIEAAALSDPDNPPLSAERLARMRRRPGSAR